MYVILRDIIIIIPRTGTSLVRVTLRSIRRVYRDVNLLYTILKYQYDKHSIYSSTTTSLSCTIYE